MVYASAVFQTFLPAAKPRKSMDDTNSVKGDILVVVIEENGRSITPFNTERIIHSFISYRQPVICVSDVGGETHIFIS